MRIAIDISQIIYTGTGVANYTNQLVRNLLARDRVNEYLLFGISLRKNKYLTEYFESVKPINDNVGSKFIQLPQTVGNILWNKFHLFPLDKIIGKVDIFHSSDWIQPPVNAKKITTVHDLIIYKYPETSHPEIIETQKRRMSWVKRECDQVICDSISTKKDMIDILKFDQNKIEVIYPGVEDIFKPAKSDEIVRVKQKYRLFDQYILFVGTMEPRKNLKNTIRAFENISNNPLISSMNVPLELVVVGNAGWGDKTNISRLIHNLGLVDRNDLPALYTGALMLVYPSLYEGFGLPVIEAMSCGCPVVTSDRGSLREISGYSALTVDPEEVDDIALKMTKLLIDRNLRESLINKGFANAKKFNWQNAADKIIDCYKNLYQL